MSEWKRDPLGLKNGDRDGWRKKIFELCPDPEVGHVVITTDKKDQQVGYECVTPDGYGTCWARVSREKQDGLTELLDGGISLPNVTDARPMATQAAEYSGAANACPQMGVYLGDGVYIDPDDAWF